MDETDSPQTPAELLVILAAIADEKIPIQTIAPKFTGRFNKGVDYVGDVEQFEKEFSTTSRPSPSPSKNTVCRVISNSASIPAATNSRSTRPSAKRLRKTDAGVHLKTAGTTWLEELIGLAEAGGEGLAISPRRSTPTPRPARSPLRTLRPVIDIDHSICPSPDVVAAGLPTIRLRPAARPKESRLQQPTSANSCTSASKSPPKWAAATSTCSNNRNGHRQKRHRKSF